MNKKIIYIVLILISMIFFSACGKKGFEQERTVGSIEKTEVVELNESKGDITIKGMYSTGGYLGDLITLDEPLIVDQNTYQSIFFSMKDGSDFIDFVPREYMAYYFEPGTTFSEEYFNKIQIELKISIGDIVDGEEGSFVEVIEIVSIDGNSEIKNRSNDEYPLSYYETVINSLSQEININLSSVENSSEVKGDSLVHVAARKLLDGGYVFEKTSYSSYIAVKEKIKPAKGVKILKGHLNYRYDNGKCGVIVEDDLKVNGVMDNQFIFSNVDNIIDYIPRDCLDFYYDSVVLDYGSGRLTIEASVDFDKYEYDEIEGTHYVEVVQLLSLCDDKNIIDRSNERYSDRFYKKVIEQLTSGKEISDDPKDFIFYNDTSDEKISTLYRDGVDILTEKGYDISNDGWKFKVSK